MCSNIVCLAWILQIRYGNILFLSIQYDSARTSSCNMAGARMAAPTCLDILGQTFCLTRNIETMQTVRF